MNGGITNNFSSYKGVRQGCVLSPLLFNLFINDIPNIFNKTCKPINIGESDINCLMYADDLVLMSESKEGMEKCLENLSLYTKKWYI